MYLVWLPEGTAPEAVRATMLDGVGPRLLALDPLALQMDLDDDGAQVPPPLPLPEGEPPVRAVVSIWLPRYDDRGPYEEALAAVADRIAGYLVTESMYTDWGGNQWSGPRSWPDGERSPGVLTVTCMQQTPRMTEDEWFDFWHTKQSPMSEAIQPRARYVRNSVARAITPGAPPYRGIVEEAWPTVADLTDPMRFYCAEGDEQRLQEHLKTMLDHVTAFLDFDTMRVHTLSEWILRS